jgi:hypothetical protein
LVTLSWNSNKPDEEIKVGKNKINIFWCNKMILRVKRNNWYDSRKDWTIKFEFLMKNHKPTNFMLSHITFNPTVRLGWKFKTFDLLLKRGKKPCLRIDWSLKYVLIHVMLNLLYGT